MGSVKCCMPGVGRYCDIGVNAIRKGMNEVKRMDINHYFIEKGNGEPHILLHGNGENCDYFINGDHFIANKHPEEFNRAIIQFLCS